MSDKIARIGDRTHGTCNAHNGSITVDGTIITGSEKTIVEGSPVARLGDTVLADCGHTSYIITAAQKTSNGQGIAAIGDSVGNGPYTATITTGAEKSYVG